MSSFSDLIITIISSEYVKRKSISFSSILPNQYLKMLNGKNSFLQNSLTMASNFVKQKQIIIVELNEYRNMLCEDLSNVFDINKNVILIPSMQDTGITAILSAIHAKEISNSNPYFLITNANHIINNEDKFRKIIQKSINNINDNSIISFGVNDKKLFKQDKNYFLVAEHYENNLYKVKNLTDKSLNLPKKSQKIFIDSGIYLTSVDFILERTKKHFSMIYEKIYEAYKKAQLFEGIISLNYKDFQEITNFSLRRLLQEEIDNFFVIPMNAEWCPITYLDITLNSNNETIEYHDLKEEDNDFFINEAKEFHFPTF